jgi:hypothetical protein
LGLLNCSPIASKARGYLCGYLVPHTSGWKA